MRIKFGFRPDVVSWCGLSSAGVSPAVFRRDGIAKIAGGTPAPQNPTFRDEGRGHRFKHSNRDAKSGLTA
jgi:hypothetical protein